MIELNHVSKHYDAFFLDNITLDIPDGQVVGIVGESGSGKSTLLKLLNLTEQPDSGDIVMNQEIISKASPKRIRQMKQSIGMIFQDYHLLNNLTVLDNVQLPLTLLGNKDMEKALYWLERVGLIDLKHQYPSQLSGGQKQRVAVARSLINQPKLILLDEATSALDEYTTQIILELMKEVHREYQPTICFISHELDSVKYLCERCLVLENGKIVADIHVTSSDKEELTSSYKEKAIRRLQS